MSDLFPAAGVMDVNDEQKIAALEREIRYRHHVYARRVSAGKMTQELADRQILIFEAILDDYRQ